MHLQSDIKKPSLKRHRLHALCPYFAMFPEAFVEKWINRITSPADTVLDPFCGRGTTPFQSILMGRNAIACDINPVAYCITKAKTNPPRHSSVCRRLTLLEKNYNLDNWESDRRKLPFFFRMAYNSSTLRQILYLRSCLKWRKNKTDCMIAALILGTLHGESEKSPSYLSNQMPRTISTKPNYSMRYWKENGCCAPKRDIFQLLRKQLKFRYESPLPDKMAQVHLSDMRNLAALLGKKCGSIQCVITSPPYLNVTSFEEDQWLRLWFLGGPPNPTYGQVSRDDRYKNKDGYWSFIMGFWRTMAMVLAPNSDIVMRIGGKKLKTNELVSGLQGTALISPRPVELIHQEVSAIQKRQTDSFRPGSKGCAFEVDCHFRMH